MSDKEERFSVRLVEHTDNSTIMELTGNPTSAQVIGILEMYRAIQRLITINAFSAAHEKQPKKKARRIRMTSKERK